jgi:hypothetical protein
MSNYLLLSQEMHGLLWLSSAAGSACLLRWCCLVSGAVQVTVWSPKADKAVFTSRRA